MQLFLKLAALNLCALTLLSACSEDVPQAVVAATDAPLKASVVDSKAQKSATVGSMGGSIRLDDRTGAIYSIELRDGAAFLQGAALLRGAQRGWYDSNIDASPKTMKNPGIGASLGQHLVVVTPKADALWVDDAVRVSLIDGNIALFEGAGEQLSQVGSLAIDSYLGPAPIEDPKQRKALVQGRLAELLKNAAASNSVWSN